MRTINASDGEKYVHRYVRQSFSDRSDHSSDHCCGRVHKKQEKVKQTPTGIILPGSGGSIAEAVLRRAHDTSYCFGEGAPK